MSNLPISKETIDYVPYTKTNTFSSKGRVTRIMGIKTGRIHHLQSDNQYRAFMYFEWADKVLDIRESYPLVDIMETIDNKEDLRFDKFKDKETNKQFMLITNFLLTVKKTDGTVEYVARTVKNTSELSRTVVRERLEIEKRYWEAKGIEWKIITEKELDRQYVKNIELMRETLLPSQFQEQELMQYAKRLALVLMESGDRKVQLVLKEFEKTIGIGEGMGIFIFRYLVAKKKIKVEMKEKIDFSKSVQEMLI